MDRCIPEYIVFSCWIIWDNLHCFLRVALRGDNHQLLGLSQSWDWEGQYRIHNVERGGNDGSKRWCGSLSSSSSSEFLHHPFSFGHSPIYREDKDGKNGVFEEEEEEEEEEAPNTIPFTWNVFKCFHSPKNDILEKRELI